MAIPIFKTDESGEFVTGYFYTLYTGFTGHRASIRQTRDWIVSRHEDEYRLVRAVQVGSTTEPGRCPRDKTHEQGGYDISIELDLFSGDTVGPFVPLSCNPGMLTSEELAERLVSSGLPEVHTSSAAINVNQSACVDPKIRLIHFRGKDATRWPQIYPESANQCPYCGHGPLVCPACGHWHAYCSVCGKEWCRYIDEKKTGPDDRRIPIQPFPDKGAIVEPERWDGSDLMSYCTITRRVLDFLLSLHAAPFRAEPLRVNMQGISKEKKELLERAKEPLKGVKPAK